jgi:hypothetical protein
MYHTYPISNRLSWAGNNNFHPLKLRVRYCELRGLDFQPQWFVECFWQAFDRLARRLPVGIAKTLCRLTSARSEGSGTRQTLFIDDLKLVTEICSPWHCLQPKYLHIAVFVLTLVRAHAIFTKSLHDGVQIWGVQHHHCYQPQVPCLCRILSLHQESEDRRCKMI